jgi:oligopeptide transport system permease protein
MFKYVVKKFILLVVSLYIVITATFFLMHLIPGDPFTEEEAIPQEILRALYHNFHLEEPLPVQYWNYLKGVMVGNFGPSFKYQGRMVSDIIREGFPVSCTLGLEALFLALAVGITCGAVAALKRTKWEDSLTMIGAILGISVPSFLLATFLQYIFAMKLDLLPVARWGSFQHTILPAIALAAMPTAFIARLTRSSMVEVLQQDYILTAKSKGLSTLRILWKHILRNALLPVVTYLGPLIASILTGSFVVEKIFGIPGLGQWFVLSVTNRDYMLIMAITIFYSFILMFSVFSVDILYFILDPRIKLWKRSNNS